MHGPPAILFCSLSIAACCDVASGDRWVIADFDGGADPRVQSFVLQPEAQAPHFSSPLDVFGPADRTASADFADDSVLGVGNPSEYGLDKLGIAPYASHPPGNRFFAVADLDNPDNPGGTGTAVWTIDITGLENLLLLVDFSAMGNFEPVDDAHSFEASIDGGPAQMLMTVDADDSLQFRYAMENGAEVLLNDPLRLTDDLGTRLIDNSFKTQGMAAIQGTGSLLTLTYTAGVNNGGNEPFAFDNLVLTDEVPVPPNPDFDSDNDVDGMDFVAIQRSRVQLIAGWQSQFGSTPVAVAVPEPSAWWLAACGLAALSRHSMRSEASAESRPRCL